MRDFNPLNRVDHRTYTKHVDAYRETAHTRAVFTGLAQALASIQTAEEFGPWTDSPSLANEIDIGPLGRALIAANKPLADMHRDIATKEYCGVHTSSAIWCGFNWGVLMLDREHMLDPAFEPYKDMFVLPKFTYIDGAFE